MEEKENKIKKFLKEHGLGIYYGTCVCITLACVAVRCNKAYKNGYAKGAGVVQAMLYADHDKAIGHIYENIEGHLNPEEIKEFVKIGHDYLKEWDKIKGN